MGREGGREKGAKKGEMKKNEQMDKRESEEFTLIGIVAEKRFKLSKKLEISSKSLKKTSYQQ